MLTKIYLLLLSVSVVVMGFLTLYSWSWLGSIGSPAAAAAGYEYHAGLSWPILWLSAAVLLVLSSSILWATGRLWPMWTTLAYFVFFVLLRAFWLDPALLRFKQQAGMADTTFTVAPIMAAILVIVAAAIVFFGQFLIIRLREKTYPATAPEEDEVSAVRSEGSRPKDQDPDNGRDGEI